MKREIEWNKYTLPSPQMRYTNTKQVFEGVQGKKSCLNKQQNIILASEAGYTAQYNNLITFSQQVFAPRMGV